MSIPEVVQFVADFLAVVLSIGAIWGAIAAHHHGIFRALHHIGKKAKNRKI